MATSLPLRQWESCHMKIIRFSSSLETIIYVMKKKLQIWWRTCLWRLIHRWHPHWALFCNNVVSICLTWRYYHPPKIKNYDCCSNVSLFLFPGKISKKSTKYDIITHDCFVSKNKDIKTVKKKKFWKSIRFFESKRIGFKKKKKIFFLAKIKKNEWKSFIAVTSLSEFFLPPYPPRSSLRLPLPITW